MILGGHRIRAWVSGSGPTVVLVHGWGGSGADMLTLAAAVAESGFRAVTLDFPAHGASPGRETSVVEWIQILRGAEQSVGALHAIVAHSLGATAALLAIGDGVRARGVVAFAPTIGPEFHLARRSRHVGIPAARVPGMLRELETRVGRSVAELDIRSVAARVDVPVLLLHATEDRAVPWAHGQAIASALPVCELVEMPGLGHRRILSDAATVERAIGFVRALG
jgi:pimeloyl-ACP methyl ester carboxylesterase